MPPLSASIILLCYNREDRIGVALAGALAQTYSPLEILISDDASTDRTAAVVEAMLHAYRGPHAVRFHRNPNNLGLGAHLTAAAAMATGEVLVLAADDDVSHPTRVARHMAVYHADPRVMAVFSDGVHVRHGERSYWKPYRATAAVTLSALTLARRGGGVGRGATYSYRRRCFDTPTPYPIHLEVEDKVLPLRAAIVGRVTYLPEPLVESHMGGDNVSGGARYRPARTRVAHQDTLRGEVRHFRAQGAIGPLRAWLLAFILTTNAAYWEQRRALRDASRRARYRARLRRLVTAPRVALRGLVERAGEFGEWLRWPRSRASG